MITIDELKEQIGAKTEGRALDYKQDLNLETEADKAEFIKDVLALANSGQIGYIITGVEDKTWRPVGISKQYSQVQLNQILQNRTDPPVRVEYAELEVDGLTHGVVKIFGEDPPYLVMVKDRYGDIQRGTIYVRNVDMNEGARRADVDRMYALRQADLVLIHEVKQKPSDDLSEVEINLAFLNIGKREGTTPYVWIQFTNLEQLVRCAHPWNNQSQRNNNVPTVDCLSQKPIMPRMRMHIGEVVVRVKKDTKQIQGRVRMSAGNMELKEGPYSIELTSVPEGQGN